jgi:5-hydroxyisourate hydrolase-like protein (transthyretin family)
MVMSKGWHGLVAALLVCGSVAAEDDAYLIRCTILEGDRVVGSPVVLAEPGQRVTVSVTDTYDMAPVYDMALVAGRQEGDRVALSADITIAGETHSARLSVPLDRASELRIGDYVLTFNVSPARNTDRTAFETEGE